MRVDLRILVDGMITKNYRKIFALFSLLLVFIDFLLLSPIAFATGQAQFTIVPPTANYGIGQTFSITIHENSGANDINAVESDLSYDNTKLQYETVDASQSAFPIQAIITSKPGMLEIARGIPISSVTGDQVIASVSFKVLATGTANISFASSSAIVASASATNIWDQNQAEASLYLTNQSSSPTTATPLSGSTIASLVAVSVETVNNKPVQGAVVSLGMKSSTTDPNGVAGFENVTAGQHQVSVSFQGKTYQQTYTVSPQQNTSQNIQQLKFKLTAAKTTESITKPLAIVTVIVIFLVGIVWRMRRKARNPSGTIVPPTLTEENH